MKSYRPTIRSMEISDMVISPNKDFLNNFWKEVAMKIECEPKAFNYNASELDYKDILNRFDKTLHYIKGTSKNII